MRVKCAVFLCMLFLFSGCDKSNEPIDKAISLRNQVLESNGCSFEAAVTADYGEQIYTFAMDCKTDKDGKLTFTVTEPETIEGITGYISGDGGALTFDEQVLAFQTMADGLVTPVTAPWLLIKTIRSGYINGCAEEDFGLEIFIDDSYEENSLHLNILTDTNLVPTVGEIFWQGRRILTVSVENFAYL